MQNEKLDELKKEISGAANELSDFSENQNNEIEEWMLSNIPTCLRDKAGGYYFEDQKDHKLNPQADAESMRLIEMRPMFEAIRFLFEDEVGYLDFSGWVMNKVRCEEALENLEESMRQYDYHSTLSTDIYEVLEGGFTAAIEEFKSLNKSGIPATNNGAKHEQGI